MPQALAYLWDIFLRLSNRRGSNGFGLDPIGWCDIDAFARLTRVRLSPWEIGLIEMLDNLFRAQHAANSQKETDVASRH